MIYRLSIVPVKYQKNKCHLRLIAANGEKVLAGELLQNYRDAMDTARNIIEGQIFIDDQVQKAAREKLKARPKKA